jgi:transcriptional regulator with XRE-family HTH domain
MTDRWSTARSRDLGKELVRVRKAKGFSGGDMARKLGWERSRVSRVELGEHGVEERDLVAWLTVCDVPREGLHRWTDLNREATQRIWFQPKDAASTETPRTLVSEESKAKTINNYELAVIPGLLQTADYTAAIAALFKAPDTAAVVAHRAARQQVLSGPSAPEVNFFIDELALRRIVGSRAIMHDQMMRLMFMSEWTKITIRILMSASDAHTGLHGAFMHIARRDKLKVVFLDTKVAGVFVETPAHVKDYEDVLTELGRLALSAEESRSFIAALADEYGRQEDWHDALAEEQP